MPLHYLSYGEKYQDLLIFKKNENTVRSNTCNVHSLVIPSAALQLKYRLCPYEGI